MFVFACARCDAALTVPLAQVSLPAHARQTYGNGAQLPVLMKSGTFAVDPDPWGGPWRRRDELHPGEAEARGIHAPAYALSDSEPGAIVISPGELTENGESTPPFEPISTWGGRSGTGHYWSWSPQWEAAAGHALAHLLAASEGQPVEVPKGLTADVFQRALDALLPVGPPKRRAVLAGPGQPTPDAGVDIILVPVHPQTGQTWTPARSVSVRIPGAAALGGVAVAGLRSAVPARSRDGWTAPRRPPRRPVAAAPQPPVPGRSGNVPAHSGAATSRSQPVATHDPREPPRVRIG